MSEVFVVVEQYIFSVVDLIVVVEVILVKVVEFQLTARPEFVDVELLSQDRFVLCSFHHA
jgi:hypothetical protein